MGKLKHFFASLAVKLAHILLPQEVRKNIIIVLMRADYNFDPRQSIRWMLQIRDQLDAQIDQKCIDWGNGVHIKHKLMDGIHSYFTNRIPSGSKVLDVGCGIGAVAYDIATIANSSVIGIDTNNQALSFAENRFKHPRLKFLQCDVTQGELPDTQVDVVILSSIIEHLPNRITLLQQLVNKYQPTLLLIRVPTFERHFFSALKQALGLFPYTDRTHMLEYTPNTFVNEMEEAGLNVRNMEIRWGDIWAECIPRK